MYSYTTFRHGEHVSPGADQKKTIVGYDCKSEPRLDPGTRVLVGVRVGTGVATSSSSPHRQLNTFAYLTANFTRNFTRKSYATFKTDDTPVLGCIPPPGSVRVSTKQ